MHKRCLLKRKNLELLDNPNLTTGKGFLEIRKSRNPRIIRVSAIDIRMR